MGSAVSTVVYVTAVVLPNADVLTEGGTSSVETVEEPVTVAAVDVSGEIVSMGIGKPSVEDVDVTLVVSVVKDSDGNVEKTLV